MWLCFTTTTMTSSVSSPVRHFLKHRRPRRIPSFHFFFAHRLEQTSREPGLFDGEFNAGRKPPSRGGDPILFEPAQETRVRSVLSLRYRPSSPTRASLRNSRCAVQLARHSIPRLLCRGTKPVSTSPPGVRGRPWGSCRHRAKRLRKTNLANRAKMRARHIHAITVGVAWILFIASCLRAQQSNPTEYQVKAAYLYNFGRFVEWPAKTASPGDLFSICVLGDDSFGVTLDKTIAGENI